MTEDPTHRVFLGGATNCDYDLFEEFADGSTVWRACIFGMANVERKLRELATESNNKFFALNLHDPAQPMIRPLKGPPGFPSQRPNQ